MGFSCFKSVGVSTHGVFKNGQGKKQDLRAARSLKRFRLMAEYWKAW
jgi:alpha/beta superfamily hydrolase